LSKSDQEKEVPWPKYLPYTSIAMGMIQPEWTHLNHFFEKKEEVEEMKLASHQTTQPLAEIPSLEIRIHFHSRK
jgi:hypothetical protein